MSLFRAHITILYIVLAISFLVPEQAYTQQYVNKDSLLTIWNDQNLSDTTRLKAINELASKGYASKQPDSAFYYAALEYDFALNKELKKYMSNALHIQGMTFYYKGDLSEAITYYTKSLDIRKEIGFTQGIASSLNNIGAIYHSKGDYKKAMDYYRQSLGFMKAVHDDDGIATTLNNLGILHKKQGDYPLAIDYFMKSLRIREKLDLKLEIAQSLNNIATLYHEMGDYDNALAYNTRSLHINKEIGEKRGIASSLSNLAYFYTKQEDYAKALTHYSKSLILYEEIGAKKQIATTLSNIGFLNSKLGKHQEALDYHQQSLAINTTINNQIGIAISLNKIGEIYNEQGKYRKALDYNNRALAIVTNIGSLIETKDVYYSLYQNHLNLKNYEQALSLYSLYIQLKDSINKESNQKEVIRQEYEYAYEKKQIADSLAFIQQQKIDELAYQNTLNQEANRRYLLYSGVVFLILLGVFILRAYYRKRKDYNLIQQQKMELDKKHDEKTAMLKEIHHRVKNNLNIVNSLLRFQSRKVADTKTLDIFKEAQNRVLSMALLHEKLYRTDDLKHIDVKAHISLLIEDLIKSYSVESRITSTIDIAAIPIGHQTLVPLGLIINEIVSNSLKHAFIDRENGNIFLTLKHLQGNLYELTIGDNGIGKKEMQESDGLGNKLIQMFVKQLKGSIQERNDNGTVYRIEFEKID